MRRLADPDDRRVRLLELTEAGSQLYKRLHVAAMAFERAALAGVTPKERAVPQSALDRIDSNVAALGEQSSAA